MDRRKLLTFFAAACLITAAVVMLWMNNGRKPVPQASTVEEQTELTVTFASGDDAWNQSVMMVCNAFMEQHPEIRIVMQPSDRMPGGFYDDFLKKQVATGELGDVVELKNINIASKEGLFAPLPRELTGLIRDPWTAPDGSVYTLPITKTEQGIIYNKSIFESLGLTVPETWQEFEEICGILKENGYTPLVIGAADSWHLVFWGRYFFDSCITVNNPSWQKDLKSGKVKWTDVQPAEMLNRFLELFEKGYVNSDYRVTGDADTVAYMADGRAAMCNTLCVQIAKIQEINPETELGWFFMPDENGQRYSVYDNQSGWGISVQCRQDEKKYEAATSFLTFFYSHEIYGEVCRMMSNLPVTWEEVAFEDELLLEICRQAEAGVLKPQGSIGNEDTPEGFQVFWCMEILEAADGEKSKEQVLAECQAEWERLSGNER